MANLMALDEMAERHLLIMGESPYEVDVDEIMARPARSLDRCPFIAA